ncbi:hypothetical protein CRUP_015546, partial [Coryphaenoides rupestris]
PISLEGGGQRPRGVLGVEVSRVGVLHRRWMVSLKGLEPTVFLSSEPHRFSPAQGREERGKKAKSQNMLGAVLRKLIPYLKSWSQDLGVPILSVDYSLAPEAPFPRALEECFYAYCWAIKNHHLLVALTVWWVRPLTSRSVTRVFLSMDNCLTSSLFSFSRSRTRVHESRKKIISLPMVRFSFSRQESRWLLSSSLESRISACCRRRLFSFSSSFLSFSSWEVSCSRLLFWRGGGAKQW